ncbi:hypothetical protein EV175_000515 [Coemansia sp. RSA 1933]|nr:hypothetical protein EV175_000515 [Coemansia sp. RSA 1933]
MHASIENNGSGSLSMFYRNGSIAYAIRYDWDNVSTAFEDALPTIQLSGTPTTVPTRQTVEFSVVIVAPTGINDTMGMFFGGILEFTLCWGDKATAVLTNSIQVPVGKYHIHASFLCPLSDKSNPDDFQTWDSKVYD